MVGVLALALAVLVIHPTWASALGVDVWNIPAMKAELRANAERVEQMQEQDENILYRIRLKEAIVADLLAHRITLADATDRFAALNESRPDYMELIRAQYPGQTDQEKLARNVIAFTELRAPVSERPAVKNRLEADLHRMRAGSAGN